MKITLANDRLKTLKKDDPDFHMVIGAINAPRAGFEIASNCPANYKQLFIQAIEYGWLKPVAYMRESEYIWEKLAE